MKAILVILSGVGIGAGLMYLFDPEGGNRRRALIRDKAIKLNRQTRETIEAKTKDLSNRAKGVVHELKSAASSENESATGEPATGWSDGPAM
jgi:Flp pilus assembly protein TadB